MNPQANQLHLDVAKRHEFVFLFDVTNGNPNGDPDAGNLPRIDPETMHGIVTDVCLKRKIRNYVSGCLDQKIFIQSEASLNSLILGAFKEVGVIPAQIDLNEEETAWFEGRSIPNFLVESGKLTYGGESISPRDITKALEEHIGEEDDSNAKPLLQGIAKRLGEEAKKNKKGISRESQSDACELLCKQYYDVRMFGAVLSTGLNAGQVRGPVQLSFARSIDPIFQQELSITRQARTTAARMETGRTEMGRKAIVPYALYRAHGYFNPFLAKTTHVSQQDLEMFWEALVNLFEFDRSAARPDMRVRRIDIFSHDNEKGNAPAHRTLELVQIKRRDSGTPPRAYGDYEIKPPEEDQLPSGVRHTELVGKASAVAPGV